VEQNSPIFTPGVAKRALSGWAAGAILTAMGLLAVRSRTREALRYCLQRRHLRRTVRIALVVGVVLTAINQLDVIVSGDATTTTWVRCGLNFLVPSSSRTSACSVGA
jgi:hypothetical protein